jgi:hypothetical protein
MNCLNRILKALQTFAMRRYQVFCFLRLTLFLKAQEMVKGTAWPSRWGVGRLKGHASEGLSCSGNASGLELGLNDELRSFLQVEVSGGQLWETRQVGQQRPIVERRARRQPRCH